MTEALQLYCGHMADLRARLDIVRSVLEGRASLGDERPNIEAIFLQLRKVLELIAFASLIANRGAYEAAHAAFASHWRVERVLDNMRALNADYYPMALEPPREVGRGQKHFDRPVDGYLTEGDLVTLYNACSEVLHTRNPYSTRDPTVQIGYPVPEWVNRIQRLLSWHRMKLLDGSIWIVSIPAQGDVIGFAAQ